MRLHERFIARGFTRPAALLLFGALSLVATIDAAAMCSGASLRHSGEMPVASGTRQSPGRTSMVMKDINMESWGEMTQSMYSTPPDVPAFAVKTPYGNGDYRFKFSKNVTHIRLLLDGEVLYDGPPIQSFDAIKKPRGLLRVEFKWEGKGVEVKVADNCPMLGL